MRTRINEPALPEPLAYFLTWGTYGSWLPGDERGWALYRQGWQLPDPIQKLEASARMSEDACVLGPEERAAVEEQVAETCRFRNWMLHAVNCRTNHLHVVLTAPLHPKAVRTQLKAWCTRRLKRLAESRLPGGAVRDNWWAERSSQRYVNDETSLQGAIVYVRDGQGPYEPES